MKKLAFVLLFAILFSFSACNAPADSSNAEPHTVQFETNGGSLVSNIETSKLTEAPATKKENQAFCGWYKDADFKTRVSYPLTVDQDMTLYAKWTNSTDSIKCDNAVVSCNDSHNFEAIYIAAPKNMDLKALAEQGYYIKMEATYDVYYEKEWDVPLDLGYKGAPNHDVLLVNPEDEGSVNKDLSTSTTATTETISLVVSAESLLNTQHYYLRLRTYNIQNVVYFENITITFTCQTTK